MRVLVCTACTFSDYRPGYLQSTLSQPQQMIMADVEDIFLPSPSDLLVNLDESIELVTGLLQSLPGMFKTNQQESALGPALAAGRELLGSIGGRITVFQHTRPNLGVGKLGNREVPDIKGTPKEFQALQPSSDFYKQTSVDASRAQIGIDLFSFSGDYIDLATLSNLPRYSAGTTYYYPGFNKATYPAMTKKLQQELAHYLTRPLGLEAVLRVRSTKGLNMHTFHGNFFIRAQDLLALPNVSPDNGYTFQISLDNDLEGALCFFQAALLYTTSHGERRIRVHTLALPVTKDSTAV